ncbi:MAG: ABC transporter permease, partial [Bacteroidota bacterium]
MLRHYSKLFKRNIVKYKFSFFINMVGLSTALACVTLIYLWVNDELLTDTFHEKDDRIFHLMEFYEFPQQTIANEVTSGNMAQLLLEEMPEVVRAVRVAKYLDNATLSIADKTIKGVGQYVDKDYFKVFSFHLIQGDKNNLWADMGTIVLSETMANSFFGSPGQAIGKTLTLQNEKQFTVSGVFTDIPKQSSEKFDFVLSYEELIPSQPNLMDWGSQSTYLYLEMEPGANVLAFNEKIHDLIREKTGNGQMHRTPFIKKYSEGYLYGKYENGIQTGGRITYVKLFAVIASFILVIACINFMNLSTARASRRLKEIGIKKVVGANRKTLIFQYLIEAIALTSMALVLSLIYVALLLPEFNRITGKQLTMDFSIGFILSVLAITLFTGLFSGSYPALYLSGFNPVSILKGKLNTSIGEVWTRKGLVIIQYMVSVILIVSVLVIYRQIEFIQNKNLGYVKEQIIHFDREGKTMDRNHMDTFLAELERVPGVISASSSRNKMTNQGWGVGGFDWEGKDPNDHTSFQNMIAYYGLLEMMDIELVEGRTFSKNFASEHTKVILNEAAIAHMQLKDPVGKTINFRGMDREIIAVVKNFHFESLHENIK